ncbi:MAG: ribonuclease HII [Nitrospirae bacterium]|nr:ribonuclease HII [Nitrospirota bacterium]MDA1303954.1 ribonuclease HII [Nitrospirota bacterium]
MEQDSVALITEGPTQLFEEEARVCGYRRVAGLDEAGRGPLAGPVVGAAVILPRRFVLEGLDDSKEVSPESREVLFEGITQGARAWAIGVATEQEIDRINILEATKLAWRRALEQLSVVPDFLLIDGMSLLGVVIPQRAVVKGDRLSLSIAAASILAKVYRDRLMLDYHRRYPQYQFHLHKGYPTPTHLRLVQEFGPCPIHRRSFQPIKNLLHIHQEDV